MIIAFTPCLGRPSAWPRSSASSDRPRLTVFLQVLEGEGGGEGGGGGGQFRVQGLGGRVRGQVKPSYVM